MENTEQKVEQVGKKVFALKSMVKEGDKIHQDGFLLFRTPEKASSIVEMCQKNLTDNPDSQKKMAFYEPYQWVFVDDFYGTQVVQRGSMFVRELEIATKNIVQEE